jgi:hypothetical protein
MWVGQSKIGSLWFEVRFSTKPAAIKQEAIAKPASIR